MYRLSFFSDIAGRVARSTAGNERVTAGCVSLPTEDHDRIRAMLPTFLPKWRDATRTDIDLVVKLLAAEAVAVSGVNVYKDTPAWRELHEQESVLQQGYMLDGDGKAGFVKPSNILKFALFAESGALAAAHSLVLNEPLKRPGLGQTWQVERTVIADKEIEGEDNLSLFRDANSQQRPHSLLRSLKNIDIRTAAVRLMSDEEERLLLLADYAAGIVHSACNVERYPMTLSFEEAWEALMPLHRSGRLVLKAHEFRFSFDEAMPGHLELAREMVSAAKATKLPRPR